MEYRTFRKWLAEHGCRFDAQSEKRGEGHGTVTIHRAGRTAELPLVGASHNLDPRSVRQVCEALVSIAPNFPDRRAATGRILKPQARCRLLALNGRVTSSEQCPLSG
jgi:mRNA interferase HicA